MKQTLTGLACAIILTTGINIKTATAQTKLYNPISLPPNNELTDNLTEKDIPTGTGGFARDYSINLTEGDQITVDLISENFDAIVSLISEDGATIAENDDGPDGSTNSLLFSRISKTGTYTIRVRAFGQTSTGTFKLRLNRLGPI